MADSDRRELGKRLAAARTIAGLTQAAVAAKLQTTERTIARWERGDSEPLALQVLALAGLVGVSLEFLLVAVEPGQEGRLMVCDTMLEEVEAALDRGETMKTLDRRFVRPPSLNVAWVLPGAVRMVGNGEPRRDIERRIEACRTRLNK